MDTSHVPEFKKTIKDEGMIIVYGDKASFRRSATLHQTWAPVNTQSKVLSKGQYNRQKIFGAIELSSGKFLINTKGKTFILKPISSFLKN